MNEAETGGGAEAATPLPGPSLPEALPGPSFAEPAFPPPGWQPPADTGLNSRPHMMDGPYWVSFDRQHWWNGSTWMLGPPPAQAAPTTLPPGAPGGVGAIATIVGLVAFGLFAVFAFGICMSMQQAGFPGPAMP